MRLVACVQIPNLPIVVARRDGAAPMGLPLILYTVERQRAVVYAASHDVDVLPGIALHHARQRCSQATCLLADPERDRQAVAALTHLLRTFSPRIVASAALPDAAFTLDLGKLSHTRAIALVERMAQAVHAALGGRPAIGVGSNCLVAQHAARRAGSGVTVVVPTGEEALFLAPQPVATVPLGVEILRRLDQLGLRTIGDVARIPLDALQAQFGRAGRSLYQLAHGMDTSPVPVEIDAPCITRTGRFAGPVLDRGVLELAITELAKRITVQCETGGWSAGAVSLGLILDDDPPVIVERVLTEPTSDVALLTQILLALSRTATLESGVTTVTVVASHLVPVVTEQLNLFGQMAGQAQRLHDVLNRLEGRFAGSLLRAQLNDPRARLPERRVRLESL